MKKILLLFLFEKVKLICEKMLLLLFLVKIVTMVLLMVRFLKIDILYVVGFIIG